MEALAECRKEQGDRWEPQLVDTLELLVIGMQQGLSLPVTLPKISAGMWLIDAQLDSEAKIDEENRVRSSSY
jgi:HD-GYP domain-containing protein (c-di-GMP phosphodiesterase class II)